MYKYNSIRPGLPRLLEIIFSLSGLMVSAPVLVIAMMAIRLSSRGPIIFCQERIGRKGEKIALYKLRSMRVNNEGSQVTAKGDLRITWIGKILRKTKLDELPELWNVIKGDLSLVGPRPEVPRYVNLSNPLWQKVLEAKPGISDPVTLRLRNEEELLAQVKGDSEQFYLDVLQPIKLKGYVEYLENRSWWGDIKILWKSVMAIIFPNQTPPPTLSELQRSDFKL